MFQFYSLLSLLSLGWGTVVGTLYENQASGSGHAWALMLLIVHVLCRPVVTVWMFEGLDTCVCV